MVDTLPAGSDVAFDHAPGSLFLRTRRGAACDAQRNNDRLNEASHPNLSRGLRQGRWRPAALTRNGSCRWRRTKFRRAAGSFPFLVALAPEPGLVALRQRFALSRLSPHPGAMANAIADAALVPIKPLGLRKHPFSTPLPKRGPRLRPIGICTKPQAVVETWPRRPNGPGRGSQLPAASRPAGVIFLKHLEKLPKWDN
jgi:hypothetical protein